jgi:hypothetical protein
MTDVVTWASNPMAELIAAYSELHPHKRCTVAVAPLEGKLGQTFFPEDGGLPEVVLCPSLTYAGMMDILAHELAHVATGHSEQHGKKWTAAYRAIHRAYARRIEAQGPTVTVPTEKQTGLSGGNVK